jgi:hypothetical protein
MSHPTRPSNSPSSSPEVTATQTLLKSNVHDPAPTKNLHSVHPARSSLFQTSQGPNTFANTASQAAVCSPPAASESMLLDQQRAHHHYQQQQPEQCQEPEPASNIATLGFSAKPEPVCTFGSIAAARAAASRRRGGVAGMLSATTANSHAAGSTQGNSITVEALEEGPAADSDLQHIKASGGLGPLTRTPRPFPAQSTSQGNPLCSVQGAGPGYHLDGCESGNDGRTRSVASIWRPKANSNCDSKGIFLNRSRASTSREIVKTPVQLAPAGLNSMAKAPADDLAVMATHPPPPELGTGGVARWSRTMRRSYSQDGRASRSRGLPLPDE